ncbi:dolichol kinase-like isoform X2 [Anneissia japonica]|uniref:dolichol kinase-like isoform X2 n=1 Tax=Anneissia japonica TaxID=1529436 RepID=UPI0014257CC5|nr:dolichol kinase-like isoform X2 [Anneissia japonica]XP_033109505.1 dolichol kinase-like isoform X2 [Anneissia japonica]
MSLAVKEILIICLSIFILLIEEEKHLTILLLAGLVLAGVAQCITSQEKLLQSTGWAFRKERNSGIVIGAMLIPVSFLAAKRTLQDSTAIYQDYQIASLLLSIIMTSLVFSYNWTSSVFKRYVSNTLYAFCLLCVFIWEGKRIYFASLFVGCVYFEGLIHFMPHSFTIGEAMVVSQALSFLTLDGCYHVLLSLEMNPLYACLQVLINGILILCICLAPVLMISKDVGKTKKSGKNLDTSPWSRKRTCVFYGVTVGVVSLILFPMLSFLLGEFVIIWGFNFIFETKIRIWLIASWVVLVTVATLIVYKTESSSTVVRKYFHLIAVAIYVPGVFLDLKLIYLASAGALFIFLIIEIVRVFRVEPFGKIIHEAFSVFIDERDSGVVILTHIYLLLGFSLPVWLYDHVNPTSGLVLYSGVISLGVGDTAAAVIGSKYGKHRWSVETVKTIEGTLAAIVTQLVACYCLGSMINASSYTWMAVTIVVVLTSLLEAFTSQIDNIVLPLFMASMFSAIQGVI